MHASPIAGSGVAPPVQARFTTARMLQHRGKITGWGHVGTMLVEPERLTLIPDLDLIQKTRTIEAIDRPELRLIVGLISYKLQIRTRWGSRRNVCSGFGHARALRKELAANGWDVPTVGLLRRPKRS